ncbi:MAG: PrsW family glutamic-type intramembrane protease [Bacilli bacterium]
MLVLAAVIPALAVLAYIYRAARHREAPQLLLLLFILGAVAVLPAGLAERFLLDVYSRTPDPRNVLLATLVTSFFIAGATEESIKGLIFYRLVYLRPFFERPYEGVLYAVAVSMGFAAVENILYVTSYGLSTAFVRTFTAIPAHALFGIVMGACFSRAKFAGEPVWRAFAVPALLHGIYDAFAMAQSFLANVLLIVYLMWLVRYAYVRAKPLATGARQ